MNGMQALMNEFEVEVIGRAVLTQCFDSENENDNDYIYLSKLTNIDEYKGTFNIVEGNSIEKIKEVIERDND